MNIQKKYLIVGLLMTVQSTIGFALNVKLTPDKDTITVLHQGKKVKIERIH